MKKARLTLVLIFIMLGAAALMGCSSTFLLDVSDCYELTMYYNGGNINENYLARYYVEKDARVPLPSTSSANIKNPVRPGFTFQGWYQIKNESFVSRREPVLREDGSPVLNTKEEPVIETKYYVDGHDFSNPDPHVDEMPLSIQDLGSDEDGREPSDVFVSAKPWSFDFDKVEGDTVLVALWKTTRQFVCLPEELAFEDPDSPGFADRANIPGGRFVDPYEFSADGSISLNVALESMWKKPGYQVEGFYLDRQMKSNPVPVDGNGRYYPEDTKEVNEYTGKPPTFVVYVKWLEEKYEIVNNADNIFESVTGYSLYSDRWYYFKSDINLNGAELNIYKSEEDKSITTTFTGGILGNGFKISNFTMNIPQNVEPVGNYNYGTIFGEIKNAIVRDITFEGLTINFDRADPNDEHIQGSFARPHWMFGFAHTIINSTVKNVNIRQGIINDNYYKDFKGIEFLQYSGGKVMYLDRDGNALSYEEYWDPVKDDFREDIVFLMDGESPKKASNFKRDANGNPMQGYVVSSKEGVTLSLEFYQAGENGGVGGARPDREFTGEELVETDFYFLDDKSDWGNIKVELVLNSLDYEGYCRLYSTEINDADDIDNLPEHRSFYDGVFNWDFEGWYNWDDPSIKLTAEDFVAGEYVALWSRRR